jgi:hypothetical protein
MDKLTFEYQKQFSEKLLYDPSILGRIDPAVKLHGETKDHPLSSSAACLNVIGSIANNPDELRKFMSTFKLEIEELVEFSSLNSIGGRDYHDSSYVIFEWIGPKKSPINETGGGRGQNRTSVDAFLLGRVNGRTTQILIEWKFTEGLSRDITLGRFCGEKGIERFRRYSPILAKLRKQGDLPFDFEDEYRKGSLKSNIGLFDLSPDHLYQLLRMTLLAKMTVGMKLGKNTLEDYRIVHLTHSQNDRINILHPEYLLFSPGLNQFAGQKLHDVWIQLLAPKERMKFFSGHWDKAINNLTDNNLKAYLSERYG